jgi:hypothetical protein
MSLLILEATQKLIVKISQFENQLKKGVLL